MGEIIEGTIQPSDFFTRAILAPCSKGLTPLHTFFASISGAYDSLQMCLHVSGLPSGFTAQQLLKYFQLQFSSAYRAEVFQEPSTDKTSDSEDDDDDDKDNGQDNDAEQEQASAFHAPRSKRLSSPPLRVPGDTVVFPEAIPLLTAAEMRQYRARSSRRCRPPRYASFGNGTGYVFFSDVHQLRAAHVELDNTSVNTTSHAPGGGPFFGSSNTAHVSGRISLRLAGTVTCNSYSFGLNVEESDNEEDEGADEKDNDDQRTKAGVSSTLSDLRKLHDIIMASKGTCSPSLNQTTSDVSTTNAVSESVNMLIPLLICALFSP